ncbi:hypothetical protein HMPREF9318_01014 [Streptococcus urinalis FB127-CNA-2]|uniref:Peptidase, S54 family n=1 Tax=Streptococcus urinalis 2285-97 TaxID=764291 RepID=G5KH78_9STRE|nr:rhomboid family intramembrane serine protease [Streptococcus urinalis]EHJ57355.1 peptidase, S54 family [Streptococcus urinalis 2285-97]EKS21060.1 hypothetical protein HMPREF9318_01014 [Streptococcus urinalis FB127-CNA-2]VEF31069.1 rhomboid family protein [Streptococcus urinalis]
MKSFFKHYPATTFLLTITILVFVGMQTAYPGQATSPQAILTFGGMYGHYLAYDHTHIWRLVTPIFVHIGLGHFFLNILALYFVGQMAEGIWGSPYFLLLYILAGISGNVFTLLFTPDVIAAGASTSLFGLFAAIMMVAVFSPDASLKGLGRDYFMLILINLVMNIFMPNVSIAGHIGGLVGGILVAIFLPARIPLNHQKWFYRLSALCLYIALMIGMLSISL